jgi:perosamine synthetase
VWVDVNQYGVPDPDHIKRLISKNTLAIIVVHQMGVPADMDAINEIVKTHNIHCIEDAACAFGSEYKGKKIGNGNNIVVYSFQARKCLTTGEGGMLVIPPDFQHVSTEKTETSKWFRSMRAFGTTVSPLERDKANFLLKEQFDKVGTNYKMCDVQAAMGLAHLSYFDEELELRRAAGLYYNEKITSGFSGRATIANLIPDYCTKYNWQNYHILLNSKYDRDVIVDVLRKKDIGCKWDIQPIHLEPAVSDTSVILQQTELFGKHGLWLPFFAEITREQQDHVIKTLNEVLT